jgi:5-methylthioadenosine/S-adenosylhomocysteine deaminase
MSGDVLVRGGELLRPDGRLERADVAISDGRIVAVAEDVERRGAEIVDASGAIVSPGLVNSHFHSGENFNPGLYENLPLDVWFVRSHQVTRREPLSAEGIYARTLLGASLMLRTGTTSVVDFLYEAPEITLETLEPVVTAYRDAGMRATILLGVADLPFAASLPLEPAELAAAREAPAPSRERIMEIAEAAVERWHEPDGMIGIGLGPSAPQRCSDELFAATLELSRRRELPWQTHVLETRTQALTARSRHGRSFVELLAERDQLGPDSTLVHTVWLSDRDIGLMAEHETTAVHCLLSNLRLGDGVARLPALRRAGVRVALGTDGRGCDETLDMLELARMTALVHKARGGDFHAWPTAADALEMCTSAASRCTGHGEHLGRIEPGAHADLLLLDRDSAAFTPLNDPLRQLVYGAGARDIRSVIVAGRVVMERGAVLGVDSERLAAGVARYAPESRAGELGPGAEELESMVGRMYERTDRAQLDLDSYIPD